MLCEVRVKVKFVHVKVLYIHMNIYLSLCFIWKEEFGISTNEATLFDQFIENFSPSQTFYKFVRLVHAMFTRSKELHEYLHGIFICSHDVHA